MLNVLLHFDECLGPWNNPNLTFGDNLGVTQSSSNPEALLKKKHTAFLSYHKVREANAAGITRIFHVPGADNQSDIFTKMIPETDYKYHVNDMMCYKRVD